MRKLCGAVVAAGLFVAAVGGGAAAEDGAGSASKDSLILEAEDARAGFVPGELVVQFSADVSRSEAAQVHAARAAEVTEKVPRFDVEIVALPSGLSVPEAAESYRRSPDVISAEPNHFVYPAAEPDDPSFQQGQQWGLRNEGRFHPVTRFRGRYAAPARGRPEADARVAAAWAAGTKWNGAPWDHTPPDDLVVAVLDSGVDVDHADLSSNLWSNPGEIAGNRTDDDGNGFVDDVRGWDFARDRRNLLESSGLPGFDHGTHVAGIAAAAADNGVGIAGACPFCKIMVLKFMKSVDTNFDGRPDVVAGTLGAELKAIDYLLKMKESNPGTTFVLNGSFTSFMWSESERAAYEDLGRAGILSVLAAGNSSLDNDMFLDANNLSSVGVPNSFSPEYPASYSLPKILSVAASNHRDQYAYSTECVATNPRWLCSFSSWGRESVDLAAPGTDIKSTVPGDKYKVFDGTSMAAPLVAGIVGLTKGEHPGYSAGQLKNALMKSARAAPSLQKTFAFKGGALAGKFTKSSGIVNAGAALTASSDNAFERTDGNVNGAKWMQKRVRGRVRWPSDLNDVVKKKLLRGRTYKLILEGRRGEDIDLVVWKPGTQEIWQLEASCYRGEACQLLRYSAGAKSRHRESMTFKARRTGVYFLQVASWLRQSSRYTLTVRRV